MQNKRDLSLDVLRIIAILMVIALHVGAAGKYIVPFGGSQWTYLLVWSILFHPAAPLFFMLSGALSTRTDPLYGIKKSLYYFFIFLVAALFYYFLDILLQGGVVSLWGILNNGILNYCYHLWFLLDMIVVMLLSPFLNRITGRALHYAVALMFLFIIFFRNIGFFVDNDLIQASGNFLSNLVPSGLLFCGYFLTGKLLYQERNKLCKYKWVPAVLFAITTVLAFGVIYHSNLLQGTLDETLLSGNSIFVFLQCISIFWLLSDIDVSQKHAKFIVLASQRTFGIYIIHVAVLNILNKLGITPAGITGIAQDNPFLTVFLVPIEILFIYLVSWLLSYLLIPIGRFSRHLADKTGEILWPYPNDN